MRNLKRALSLALASVMLLGMMVVGTSAASYTDVDDNDNVEAIEVLNAVNVMIGRQGNFEPDEAVNRHEMAVIMAKLYLGVEAADNYVGSHPFTDVVPWADKYVAACYENGLVAGTSATTFSGGNPLTAVQAAAMMLRALGYKDLSKGADNWSVPVTAMANQIRLFSGVASNPSEKLNRNQVAQLALNTLKSPVVTLKDNTISWSNDEGQLIMTGGSREYIVRFSQEDYAYAINDTETAGDSASGIQGATIELGEHLYNGKLQLNNTTDDFGRPSRKWEYNGKTIGTYVKEELMVKEYVGKVTGKDLYDQLGSTIVKDYDLTVTIDGVDDTASTADQNAAGIFGRTSMDKNNKAAVGRTGTGTLTQVFVDNRNISAKKAGKLYIAIINTYLAKANQDYDAKKEELSVTIHGVNKPTSTSNFIKDSKVNQINGIGAGSKDSTAKLALEDFSIVKDMKKDEFLLVNVAGSDVVAAEKPEILSGVSISGFKKNSDVVVDGTKYEFTTTAHYKDSDLAVYTSAASSTINLQDATYNIYLDVYGNLIGVEEVNPTKNYVFITGNDLSSSNYSNKTAKALGLFLDGTSEEITYRTDRTGAPAVGVNNVWCTYTKDKSNVYTLKQVARKLDTATGVKLAQFDTNETATASFEINSKDSTLLTDDDGVIYGKADSVYLVADRDVLKKTDNNTKYGAIKGTDTLIVDVKKADIAVWSQAQALANYTTMNGNTAPDGGYCYGAYALYNDGYGIIAAVVIGEDNGVSKKWYNTGDEVLLHEDYITSSSDTRANDGAGEWVWTRELFDEAGNRVTLTERGDSAQFLQHMNPNQDYLIKLNGKGEVYKAYRLPGDTAGTVENLQDVVTAGQVVVYGGVGDQTKAEVVTDYTKIGDAVKTGKNQMLVSCDNLVGRMNTSQSGLLYVKSGNDDSGILVTDDTKVVLVQYNRNAKTTYEDGVGFSAVKGIIDGLNQRYGTNDYNYKVSAVLDSRKAKSIMIYDYTKDWNGGTQKPGESESNKFGNFTFVTNSDDKVVNKYAMVNASNEVVFRFGTDKGATDTSAYTFKWKIETEEGKILMAKNDSASASAASGLVTVTTSTSGVFSKDTKYIITISEVKPVTFKTEVSSVPSGIDLTKASVTPTSLATNSAQALALTISGGVKAAEKVDVYFRVKNAEVTAAGSAVLQSTGEYKLTDVPVTSAGAISSLSLLTAKADGKGAVQVEVTGIVDASTKVAVRYVVDPASNKYVSAFTAPSAAGALQIAVSDNTTDVDASSGNITLVPAVTKADIVYTVNKVAAGSQIKQENETSSGSPINLKNGIVLPAAKLGDVITVTISVVPKEYTVPINASSVTVDAGTAPTWATSLKFDGNGDVIAAQSIGGANSVVGAHYLIKLGTKDAVLLDGESGPAVKTTAGCFHVDPASLVTNNAVNFTVKELVKVGTIAANISNAVVPGDNPAMSVGKYNVTITGPDKAATTIDGTKYVEMGAKWTVTITLTDGTGVDGGSGKKDTITITAADQTITEASETANDGDIVFAGSETGDSATVTATVTAKTKDLSITVKGANA